VATKLNKNRIIAAAQKYIQKGNYDRAIREYAKIIEQDPRDVRIWLKIGDLYAKKKAISEAVDTYLKVAEYYSEQGFYLKAVAVYKQILKLDPSLVDINLKLAELYKQLGLLKEARQQYELVCSYYHQAGHTKYALEAVRQMVDMDPDNVASRIKLGELYSKEGMRPEAVGEFGRAADYLRASNRLDDFIKVAERLIYHQPDNLPITKELASLYLRRSDARRALQKLQLAFKSDPRDEETLGMLAQAFEQLGQVGKAVSVLRELAQIHTDNSQRTKLRETLQRILSLAPGDAQAQKALASAGYPSTADASFDVPGPAEGGYEQHDAPNAAEQEIASLHQPQSAQLSSGAHGAYDAHERDGYDELTGDIARVLTEVDVYIKYGLCDKALEHLQSIFVRAPQNVEIRLKLRDLYVEVGRPEDAAKQLVAVAQQIAPEDRRAAALYLNDALELAPGNAAAVELLQSLEEGIASLDDPYPTNVDHVTDLEEETYDSESLVEEIPIDEADLIEVDEVGDFDPDARTNIRSSHEVQVAAPMGTDTDPEAVYADDTDSHFPIDSGSGVVEVHGERENTLGGTSPASQLISLPVGTEPEEKKARPLTIEDEGTGLDDDLEEIDFFIQQNLLAEARSILDGLRHKHAGDDQVAPRLEERLKSLSDAEQKSFPLGGPIAEDSTADLVAQLAAELEDEPLIPDFAAEFSVEDVFDEFKRGVDNQISDEDSETHYDLGIAYREMGLIDDAIAEFNVAMKAAEKEVLCHMMIGLCYSEKGLLTEAISQFKTGLYVEGISTRETISLYFELGQAYETIEDFREALYYYEKVSKKDTHFRQVEERIKRVARAVEEEDEENANDAEDDGDTDTGSDPRELTYP
jgi:pilus assembly protein FimV